MEKEPKIVQVVENANGVVSTVLYSNGRVFTLVLVVNPDTCTGTMVTPPHRVCEWRELVYPIPRIPIPPKSARKVERRRKR
jgi:hypothetical protein